MSPGCFGVTIFDLANKPLLPAKQPLLPAKQPLLPAKQPVLLAKQPLLPAKQPMLPVKQPLLKNIRAAPSCPAPKGGAGCSTAGA